MAQPDLQTGTEHSAGTAEAPLPTYGEGALRSWAERFALPGLLVLLALVFALLPATGAEFATLGTLGSIGGTGAVTLVLTLGLIMPGRCGDFDLSVAYILTFSSMLVAILNVNDGLNIVVSVVIALVAGTLVGVVNALLAVLLEIDSFIATLGSGTVVGGIVLWMSHSNVVSGVSPGLSRLVIEDTLFHLPYEFYFALVLTGLVGYTFSHTPIGRRLLYVGQSRDVARLSGVNVSRIRAGSFIVGGLLSALAGVLYTGTAGAADPTSGTTLLLPAFAAAFLGSTAITPGQFNAWGAFIAVYFLGTGVAGLEMLGASSYVQDLFYGGALIVAVFLSGMLRKRAVVKR